MKEILIDNHSIQKYKGKVFGQLALEHFFALCDTFQKVTKNLGCQLFLETIDSQRIVYTTLPQATLTNVTIDNLHFFEPNIIPIPETQVDFNQFIKKILPYHLIL